MNLLNKIYNAKETSSKSGRIYYFDNLKFVLIFLVVFGHLIDPIIHKTDIAKSTFLFIYLFHMPLFVFLSGFFSKNSVKRKDKNKVIVYLFLYIILKVVIFTIEKLYGRNVSFNLFSESSISWYLFAMAIWHIITMLIQNFNKKYVMFFSILLALIIGFDKNIRDFLCLSRIIVFYPFFLIGNITKKEHIYGIIKNKKIRIASIIFLTLIIYIVFAFIDNVYLIRPLLTGRNSYYSLNNNIENFGILFRLIWYIISSLISVSVMSLTPRGKTFFSKFGENTLAVLILYAIIVRIFAREGFQLRVYQYLIISIIVTFIFSLKWFSIPFNKILKLNLYKKENGEINMKIISNIIMIFMIISILCLIVYITSKGNIQL